MNASQIGVEVSKEQFASFLNSVRPGQFFHVKGYVNEQGEKADHWLRFGIKYGNLKDRDVKFLRGVLQGDVHSPLKVKHGVWIPEDRLETVFLSPEAIADLPDDERHVLVSMTLNYKVIVGEASMDVERTGTVNPMDTETFTNRKAKGKVQATASYVIPLTHPLVVAAIGGEDLQGTLLQGLLKPREATAVYDKEAQSAYSMEKDGQTRWYLRDVLRVHKVVRVEGNYEFTATLPINGVKKAIESAWLLTSKYRQFILTDGQFESITIDGQAMLVDGVDEMFYFALPETVKEAELAEAL